MRYTSSKKIYPKVGDKRLKYKFLWFPLAIGKETRWLEKVIIQQEYSYDGTFECYGQYWENVAFVDAV